MQTDFSNEEECLRIFPIAHEALVELKKCILTGVLPDEGGWEDQKCGLNAVMDWVVGCHMLDDRLGGVF